MTLRILIRLNYLSFTFGDAITFCTLVEVYNVGRQWCMD
jgi:hypothetical protein